MKDRKKEVKVRISPFVRQQSNYTRKTHTKNRKMKGCDQYLWGKQQTYATDMMSSLNDTHLNLTLKF